MQPHIKKYLLLMICIISLLPGCHQETAAERRARLKRERNAKIALIVILGLGAGIGLVVAGKAILRHLHDVNAKELRLDPTRYNNNIKQINQFASECRFMLFEDAKRERSFKLGTASKRARKKMIEFIVQAQGPARRLMRNDPTRDLYVANEELARLYNCCENCSTHNRNRKSPVCLALDGKQEVDLRFEKT